MAGESESILLQRFQGRGDSEAFSEIVRRHVGMVYGVCVRLLEDKSDAADVTQETFFSLTRQAREVSGSVAGWLHRVATRKCVDLIRRGKARRRTERAYAAEKVRSAETWQELSPHVDQAMGDMHEELRSVLVEHFFEGKTTTQIAKERKISQATVSRRLNHGLELLQVSLKKKGLLATVAVVGALLAEARAEAVPAALAQEMAKMAMVGSGAAGGVQAAGGGVLSAMQVKVVTAVAVMAIGAGSVLTYNELSQPADRGEPKAAEITGKVPGRRVSASRPNRRSGGPTVVVTGGVAPAQGGTSEGQAEAPDSETFDEWFERVFAEESGQDGVGEEPVGLAMGSFGEVPMGGMAMGGMPPAEGEPNEEAVALGAMLGGTYLPDVPPAEANEAREDLPSDDQ